jgi:hypothetical protein
MDRFESDLMEDLMSDAAEGPAARAANPYDDYDDFESAEEGFDEGDEDAFLGGLLRQVGSAVGGLLGGGGAQGFEDDAFEEDGFDEDGFEADGFAPAAQAFDEGDAGDEFDAASDAMADALEEEDADAFFRRLRNIAGRIGRGIGQVARTVAPIASAIPLPWTQAIGRVANVAGRLLADGADEFEAIDELVDGMSDDAIDAAIPVVAGLAVRRALPAVARLSRPARRQIVRQVAGTMRSAVRRQGRPAARVVARTVRAAGRAVQQRRMPVRRVGAVVRRATGAVIRQPAQARRLARPLVPAARRVTPRGQAARVLRRIPATTTGGWTGGRMACRCGARHLVLRGPVNITIAR